MSVCKCVCVHVSVPTCRCATMYDPHDDDDEKDAADADDVDDGEDADDLY